MAHRFFKFQWMRSFFVLILLHLKSTKGTPAAGDWMKHRAGCGPVQAEATAQIAEALAKLSLGDELEASVVARARGFCRHPSWERPLSLILSLFIQLYVLYVCMYI